jgi:uncharacterized membrane protein YraQ (UPF0718 family)
VTRRDEDLAASIERQAGQQGVDEGSLGSSPGWPLRSPPAGSSAGSASNAGVEPFVFETRLQGRVIDSTTDLTLDERLQLGLEEVRSILREIWPYLLVGIGLGALIHG